MGRKPFVYCRKKWGGLVERNPGKRTEEKGPLPKGKESDELASQFKRRQFCVYFFSIAPRLIISVQRWSNGFASRAKKRYGYIESGWHRLKSELGLYPYFEDNVVGRRDDEKFAMMRTNLHPGASRPQNRGQEPTT